MTMQMPPPVSHRSPADANALRTATLELRRELARVERALRPGETSDEREELLLALQRVDDGTYGICGECDRPIAPERLDVMPATRWCVTCVR